MRQKGLKWEDLEKIASKYEISDILAAYKPRFITTIKNPKLHHLAWKVFADYIVLKKSEKGMCKCITCGTQKKRSDPQMQAGHFRKQGESLKHKYNEDNVWPQCYSCNVGRDGNYQIYTIVMIDKFGREWVDHILKDKDLGKIREREYVDNIKIRYDYIQTHKL